jgi:hypothetical protein
VKDANPNFTLCDYFNKQGRRLERIYIANEPGEDAVERVRACKGDVFERLHDAMFTEAHASGALTDLGDAALALNVILNEVAENRMALEKAREITSIGVNFRQPVEIADIIPTLETSFGGYAVSWVRGIFSHLNLGSPRIQ